MDIDIKLKVAEKFVSSKTFIVYDLKDAFTVGFW